MLHFLQNHYITQNILLMKIINYKKRNNLTYTKFKKQINKRLKKSLKKQVENLNTEKSLPDETTLKLFKVFTNGKFSSIKVFIKHLSNAIELPDFKAKV